MEPLATEVTNVCLVQKGYPSPHTGEKSLRHVGIYKENFSPIDFVKTTNDFHKADASQRSITIHGTPDRPVLPTSGAADLAGASPQTTRPVSTKTQGSEINATGIGGGVVFTMDDVTFGLEVCLDHANDRLSKFYAGTVAAGDPKVQSTSSRHGGCPSAEATSAAPRPMAPSSTSTTRAATPWPGCTTILGHATTTRAKPVRRRRRVG